MQLSEQATAKPLSIAQDWQTPLPQDLQIAMAALEWWLKQFIRCLVREMIFDLA
jgi:hypothetical protein